MTIMFLLHLFLSYMVQGVPGFSKVVLGEIERESVGIHQELLESEWYLHRAGSP